jgi:hypothetical protein
MRFEEPDGARKWDAPLFTVLPEDAQPPMEEIIAAITIHRATHAKLSTLVVCWNFPCRFNPPTHPTPHAHTYIATRRDE